jgi:large subunit ribosomal protein L29|uniref:Large ribosomal subunit protein uL29c n=2 Tax=Phaeodactylum tricornutum TaxID=2850 RepID=RK29_PHATC|nr:ribosomal protein L29 [Phaeodactylum tricornutum]A0T0I7.1 RecName: Full=Large ribosomal subunit protein uL29c; AltName: Full=50S ribosomal protein L29, chloroplastic [Phaeodactylum tricornutum CCAP 1055/1]ABK20685.1 50S ribosomal protein L29 [Phaeodactylum tricornutum]QHR85639.1 50S ribosomal protein L29 [Phaeodactylum tricornutum]
MSLPAFTEISSFSNTEISVAIIETENQLFNLRFKKATRQSFKSHEIKNAKRRLAQLKTLLSLRLENLDQKDDNLINTLITN